MKHIKDVISKSKYFNIDGAYKLAVERINELNTKNKELKKEVNRLSTIITEEL